MQRRYKEPHAKKSKEFNYDNIAVSLAEKIYEVGQLNTVSNSDR